MYSIVLVRHAHSDWTPDENRALSPQGLIEADRLPLVLHQYNIKLIYSSPALRAIQTVSPFANQFKIPIVTETDLQERRMGDAEFEDFNDAIKMTWADFSFAYSGGESNYTAQKRGYDFLRFKLMKHKNENILLSTHGNLMTLILNKYIPSIGFSFWEELTMPDVYILTFDNDQRKIKIKRVWEPEVIL